MARGSLNGQITIKVEGRNIERLINKAIQRGVKFSSLKTVECSDASRHKRTVTMTMKARHFKHLRYAARKSGCKIHIIKKNGIPFRLNKLHNRPVLMFGWIAALAILLFLSRLIWVIEIEGCYSIPRAEIINRLSEMGITIGKHVDTASVQELSEALASGNDKIAWANVCVSGVTLSVKIVEAELPPQPDSNTQPQSLYAKSDGIITKVTALSGHAAVSPGDAVYAGDVLITGDLSTEEKEIFVCARGEVLANVLYRFVGIAGPKENSLVRNGNSKNMVSVELFSLNLLRSPYEHFEKETVNTSMLHNLFLPIAFNCHSLFELKEESVNLIESELGILAESRASQLMHEGLPKNALLVSKSTVTETLDDGSVRCVISVTVEENIASYQ